MLVCDSLSLFNLSTVSIRFFNPDAVEYFFHSITVSFLRLMKVTIGVINEFEASNLFKITSGTAWM